MSDDDILSSKPVTAAPKAAATDTGDIVSAKPPSEHMPLERSPEDTGMIGRAKNWATGALTGMSTLAGGMAGDTLDAAKNIAAGAVSTLGPRSTQDILDMWKEKQTKDNQARIEQVRTMKKPSWSTASDADWERQRQRKLEALGINNGEPPTTQDVYSRSVAPKLGSYEPSGPLEAAQQAGVAGAVPGMLAGPTGGVAGALGGITSTATSQLNPFWRTVIPLAAGASVPTIAKGTGAVKRGISGKNATEQQAAADKLLAEQTNDPAEGARLARERAGMDDETLAEATVRGKTGDRGLAKAQDTMLTKGGPDDPTVKAVQAGQEGRGAAMIGALQGIAKDAAPEDVSAAFQQHHDALLKDIEDNPPPTAPPLDESGAALQEQHIAKNQAAKDTLAKLKDRIDPERKAGMWAGDVTGYANDRLGEAKTQPDLKRNPVVDDYLTRASQWGNVKSFRDSMDFVRSLNDDIGQLQKTNPTAARDLILLKKKVQDAQNSAIENQHRWEQVATERGEMPQGETFADRLQREQSDWYAARAGGEGGVDATRAGGDGEGGGPGVRPHAGERPAGEAGSAGAQGEDAVGGGSAPPGGPGGVAGDGTPLEPLSPEAAGDLRLFNTGHGLRKDTFENGPAGDMAKAKLGADAAAKAFVSGPKGFEVGQSVLNAGGAEALANMKDIAVGRLQTELKGKPLDQKALNAFKTKHLDALRAIDEKEPGFSNSFNDAAAARTAVQEFENTAAAKFLGKEGGDVVNHVRGLMQAKDSTPIRALVQQAEQLDGAPNGPTVTGLRRAAAQAFENDFDAAGPRGIIKALRDRRANLDAIFEPEAVAQMEKVADSIEKSATVQALGRQTVGSPTGERTAGMKNLDAQLAATVGKDVHSGVMDTGMAIATWEMLKEAGGSLLRGDVAGAAARAGGIGAMNLFKAKLEHALAARRLKTETNVTRLFSQGLASREVGAAMLERAINADGTPNQLAIEHMADALAGVEASQQREGRATGGRIGKPEDAARKMIEAVGRARKMDTAQTKPLLQVSDHAVATALAAAGRSI